MTNTPETFSFADSPAIVRAHQKDSYFESVVKSKLQLVIQLFRGQRFVNTYPGEITVLAQLLYLGLTTLRGSKTLGEEYADLIYVTRNGKALPKKVQRLAFVLSYLVVPYVISKLLKRYIKKEDDDDQRGATKQDDLQSWLKKITYTSVLTTIMNIHIAIFYLQGSFYHISKRIFGLRYAFGHKVDPNRNNGSYEVLGFLILAQLVTKALNKLNEFSEEYRAKVEGEGKMDPELLKSGDYTDIIYGNDQKGTSQREIDLLDASELAYLPESSRKCMLCLEYMKLPSLTPCGHLFCWTCVCDWHKERPECPLCRQLFNAQEIIPLR